MSNYPEGSRDYLKEEEDDLPYKQDTHFLESIKNHQCPYDDGQPYEDHQLIKEYQGKHDCTWCDFLLLGDYKLLAYTKDYPLPSQPRNDICDECGEPTFYDPETSEYICSLCGLVTDEDPYMNEIEIDGRVRFIGEPPRKLSKQDRTLIGNLKKAETNETPLLEKNTPKGVI
jgi:hypothetical protein